jgi:hypothetical protein
VVPLGTLCGYALDGTQMDNLLNLERLALSVEQAIAGRKRIDAPPSVALGSLMEMRFLSSCTNVSRM